jgi:hypothetical protein
MNPVEIIDNINTGDLIDFYNKNEDHITWKEIDNKGRQTSLQYAINHDIWLGATERTQIKSKYFFLTNPFFHNSEFENILKKYKLFRTRLLWLNSQSCYSMHFDDTPRIHIPLITNEDSFIVFKTGIVEHLEVGKVYWVDTRETHTAINGGEKPRLHLVGCVY